MGRMSRKEFAKFLDRDLSCVHCGKIDETVVPQHRANRGMGGSHKKEKPSNVVVMCSWFNCQIEMDPYAARLAKTMGWKLEQWQDSDKFPIYHHGKWWMLDDNYGRTELPFWDEPN